VNIQMTIEELRRLERKRQELPAQVSAYLHCRILVLFLISITLVSSSYLLPLAYSQEFAYISTLGEFVTEETSLSSPEGIAVDSSSGNVYVADTVNNNIKKFSSNGTFITAWGRHGTGNGSLSSPRGIALDQAGNVYVADTDNNRIQVFSNNGTFISKVEEYGRLEEGFRSPEGIAVDSSSGNVYVADTGNNRISVFTSRSPIGSEAFLSEEGEIFGNGTTDQIILPGIF
jgi:tripartite motif-containing protein 71